ncbi:hypothetical protein DY000_02004906 [Brassica cretica]|uniref:Uncharacterized protein n=1 Tax=Brassica cretica TaxID=69181 RepID=A0ABQ7BU35_BRACR|nr:hypothetical protein DY000_02004906 [Brassica cretica]
MQSIFGGLFHHSVEGQQFLKQTHKREINPPQKPSEANWQSRLMMVYYYLRDEMSAGFLFRRRRPLWEGRRRIGGDCSAVMNMPC